MKPDESLETKNNIRQEAGFQKIPQKLFDLITDESAQGLTEYALILGVVSLICIATIAALGENVYNAFFFKVQSAVATKS